ncbi:MAG: hypothetical protein K6A69_04595 [Lachnospiraceae bacterium]|nr:hypothetical protein [Lachnospiraceae bacterium]
MKKEVIYEIRHELLERLQGDFTASGTEAEFTSSEEGAPEMVTAFLDELGDPDDEIYGQFFFHDMDEDDEVQYFVAAITFWDNIPEDRLSDLFESISYINFTLPAGRVSIDKDHNFCTYMLSTPIPIEVEGDELYRQMDMISGNAIAVAGSCVGVLNDVLNGVEDVDGVVDFLGGRS